MSINHDPDHHRFSEGRNGIADCDDSPVDLSGREGAPRRHTGADDGDCWCEDEDCNRGDYDE